MDKIIKHKIGQMLIAGFPSPEVDDQARRLVEDFDVGNFALFGRNIVSTGQTSKLCQDLTELVYNKTGFAPLICADQEGGVVTRVCLGATLTPGTMAQAASPSSEPYQMAKNSAKILTTLGLNTTFAPVLDVNIEPMNPIIGSRAFADNAETVMKLGIPMTLGFQAGGMLATMKHYPGHGNVKSDSHLGVPFNDSPLEVLERDEWVTFAKAIEAGAESLMTCHVVYRNYDPDYPATVSYKVMTELLREKMHFNGLAVTDCMEMDAIRATYGCGEGAVMAIEAGCDLITFSHTYEAVSQAANAIYAAVESGRLSMERIDLSYNRIMAAKKKFNLLKPPVIDQQAAREVAFDPEKLALTNRVSRDSMTLIRDNGGLAALKNAKKPAFFAPASVAQTGAEDEKKEPTKFSDMAAARFGGTSTVFPLNELDEATKAALHDDSYDVAVLGLYNARFREGQQAVLRELERQNRPLVVILLGAPYDEAIVERADSLICAYEYTILAAEALLDAIEAQNFPGKLPVKL